MVGRKYGLKTGGEAKHRYCYCEIKGMSGNAGCPQDIAMWHYKSRQYLAVILLFPDSPFLRT